MDIHDSYKTKNYHEHNKTRYILIGSPIGAKISENGVLTWHPDFETNDSEKYENDQEEHVEFFIVKVSGGCEEETALIEITVHINYGPSHTEDNSR